MYYLEFVFKSHKQIIIQTLEMENEAKFAMNYAFEINFQTKLSCANAYRHIFNFNSIYHAKHRNTHEISLAQLLLCLNVHHYYNVDFFLLFFIEQTFHFGELKYRCYRLQIAVLIEKDSLFICVLLLFESKVYCLHFNRER